MLVLARHGECVANTERLYVGRSESPLTERGERQAARLAAVLVGDPGLRLERIVTSPLGRAVRTAEVIAAALSARGVPVEIEIDERFVELDYGELDGEPVADGRGAHPWREDPQVPFPKGESLVEVAERVERACAELWASPGRAAGGAVLVVSHVLPIKLAVCWSLGIAPAAVWRMTLAVASLTRITGGGSGPSLERYNEHGYLYEDASPPIWR